VNQTGKDEIQIRKLDNGKYIIVLPGVVDLSSGIATRNPGSAVKEWMDPNDANSVRDMRYAIPSGASPDYANPYATRVKEAMLAAGVPPGSDVMLVGHSYGAYTAAYLASDHDFNDAFGSPSGYHVNVTHMVAAGAETDVYFDRMPEGTHALVLNNRRDLAYEAEDNAHGNVDPVYGGQKEFVFNGGGKGWGHDPQNYTDWLQNSTDREDLGAWLDSAGDYAESGSAVNYTVPDVE
jgi:pimeloyl-ACP methyl ester carboxylesterase